VSARRQDVAQGLVAAGLLRADLVAGVEEPVDAGPVGESVERLLDGGSRLLVVSLDRSWQDPTAERAVRAAIHELFPPYFLGAVRVFLASDLSALPGLLERTNTAVLNAFVHDRLARSLYKAEEDLRRRGLRRPLMVVHGHAGLARAAKTLAVHTYNSGPVAGVLGAAARGADAGKVVVTLDIGGTSADLSLADADGLSVSWTAEVSGLAAHLPAVPVGALAVGGGSIAWIDGGRLNVGPRSAGAHPGPACFDRGGTDATLTDANLLLGLLDSAGFHGGRLVLKAERAATAVRTLADALATTTADVARRIRDEAERRVAAGMSTLLARRGVEPSEAVLVAYGGGGPLHAAAIAARAGIGRVVVPTHAAVFSALGVSGLDVQHVYPLLVERMLARGAVGNLIDVARRDMVAEGFGDAGITAQLELLDPARPGNVLWREAWDAGSGDGAPFGLDEAGEAAAAAPGHTLLVLTVTAPTPHAETAAAAVVAGAAVVQRPVDWGDGPVDSAVLTVGDLAGAAPVRGPALIISADTTVAVPPGWSVAPRPDGALVLEAS
jgi:N-methylhydantoinase A